MFTNITKNIFVNSVPSHQNIIDIFPNTWKSKFPSSLGIHAGKSNYFEDQRVEWVSSELGGLKNKSIVELGPFEAYNTFHLAQKGAYPLVAIEGNKINFLKCLAVKEILDFNCKFKLGDCTLYLESCNDYFDLIFASGILYHQTDPLRFLKACSEKTKNLFIWTHFFKDSLYDEKNFSKHFNKGREINVSQYGFECMLYPRSYNFNTKVPPQLFSGGFKDFAYWMRYDDIVEFLKHLGFNTIKVRSKGDHPAGPITSLLASK